MSDFETHVLAPPYGLPGNQDSTLFDLLRDDEFDRAVTLLRDAVTPETRNPKWLLLLAYARFRDAHDVMFDEVMPAAIEALTLIDRAVEAGAPFDDVMAFRTEVETVLDEESRAEVEALAKLPPEGESLEQVDGGVLLDTAFRLWGTKPARAALLFLELARRQERDGLKGLSTASSIRAGLCFETAKQFEQAKPLLELALTADWQLLPLSEERGLAETAVTGLLMHATGPEVEALWLYGATLGLRFERPFPSVWPNQEALLKRFAELRDFVKARQVAHRIEDSRETLPRALSDFISNVRREQV